MLAESPVDMKKVRKEEIDKSICRIGMVAELDAVSFYEQLAAMTDNHNIRKVLLDIAKEEKTHMGEFEEMLLRLDGEQVEELAAGKKEVQEMTGK